MPILLADAGGTNIRTAWTENGSDFWGEREQTADSFDSLGDALASCCQEEQIQPDCAILAVAGPVREDRIQFTNRPWSFSRKQLKKELQLEQLEVMNDFAAVALALPVLEDSQIDIVRAGKSPANAAMLAIGPGTGLGVAGVVPAGRSWCAIPGEGGHCSAALDHIVPHDAQQRLWHSGSLSWEHILSGPGLPRLHSALHCANDLDTPEKITSAARSGDDNARQTLSCFSALLGRCTANAALLFGAWGGAFLGGGLVKSMQDSFDRDAFVEGFESRGTDTDLLRHVSVGIITEPYPAFTGLVHAASFPGQ